MVGPFARDLSASVAVLVSPQSSQRFGRVGSEVVMLAVVRSSTLLGVDGFPVHVEVHVANGLPSFTIVGLPDASCRESRDRARAAISTSGLKWPDKRITVNLAPTNLRKAGSALDLAVAIGVLVASDQLGPDLITDFGFLGELGLNGALRPIVGALPLVHALGEVRPVVPPGSFREALLVGRDPVTAGSLLGVVDALKGKAPWDLLDPNDTPESLIVETSDLIDVQGQPVAKRALEVAAAGGHHVLMTGPPGAGKTMLAERLPTLMPDLDDRSAFEVSRIHSAAGRFHELDLIRRPPLRAPHHSASLVALLGGGTSALRPGEVSMASDGVLFLDELGEFPTGHLDALRQPLESGEIHIARASASAVMPARFLLVAATNPCPCGVGKWGDCRCSVAALTRYARRLSGPLLDRFDIRLAVDPPDHRKVLTGDHNGPTSAEVRTRVSRARAMALSRGVHTNRELAASAIDRHAPLTLPAKGYLRRLLEDGTMSMRGVQRLRLMALTIRDLESEEGPVDEVDLAEAMLLRGGDRQVGVAS